MASTRGLSVELSMNATQFNKGVTDAKKSVKSMTSEVSNLTKSLKLDFDADKLVKAQGKAQDAIDKTADLAEVLKARLKSLEDAGNVDTSEYHKIEQQLSAVELQAELAKKQLEELNNIKFEVLADSLENTGSKIESLGKGLSVASGAAAALGTALGKSAIDAVAVGDDLGTLATQYGITAEALQELKYIALQTDVADETLYKGLVKTRAALADLATGTSSTASSALASLGLSLDGLDEGQQFMTIISALADMEDKTKMASIANEVFGEKLANNLLPMIYSGSEAINQYASEFEDLGALSNEQVAALGEMDNVLNKIKTQFKNAYSQIGTSLLPIMSVVTDYLSNNVIPKIQELGSWFNSLTLEQQELGAKAILLVAALGPVVLIIGKLTSGVGGLVRSIPQLISGLNVLMAHPIIAAIGVVTALLTALYFTNEDLRNSINELGSTLLSALSPVLTAFTPIIRLVGGVLTTIGEGLAKLLVPNIKILTSLLKIISPLMQGLGQIVEWLAGLFEGLGSIVLKIFDGILEGIDVLLGNVEDAINWIIDKINVVIRGLNNVPGIDIQELQSVELTIKKASGVEDNTSSSATTDTPGYAYDNIDTSGVYNNATTSTVDNSTTTQNISIVIENYSAELDVDAAIEALNLKLAEAM